MHKVHDHFDAIQHHDTNQDTAPGIRKVRQVPRRSRLRSPFGCPDPKSSHQQLGLLLGVQVGQLTSCCWTGSALIASITTLYCCSMVFLHHDGNTTTYNTHMQVLTHDQRRSVHLPLILVRASRWSGPHLVVFIFPTARRLTASLDGGDRPRAAMSTRATAQRFTRYIEPDVVTVDVTKLLVPMSRRPCGTKRAEVSRLSSPGRPGLDGSPSGSPGWTSALPFPWRHQDAGQNHSLGLPVSATDS